jgi:hypothetical protein
MSTLARRIAAAAVVCGAVLAFGPPAPAQVRPPANPRLFPVNPNLQIAPGVTVQAYAPNTAVLGRTYHQVPPYLLGYNAYPVSANYGPVYNPQVFRPAVYSPYVPTLYNTPVVPPGVPYAGGYGPYYGGNAYTGGYGPGTPYDPSLYAGGYSAYNGGYNPYYWNPYNGGYNYSTAYELQAYAQLGVSQEQARILREQANQAKLDTRKKTIDTLAYIRANEYTFTQEQADIAKKILERVQKTPTNAEIVNGKSLNILIDDLGKFGNKQFRGQTVTLDEDVLKLINVTGPGGGGANIALLRDNGRFNWPSVFEEKFVDAKLRKDIELQAQELFQQSLNAKIDKNVLKDLKANLRVLRETLTKNRSEVLTQNYLEGQRFLDDFDNAVLALERGDAALNVEFQSKFAKGGKTVQELVEYLTTKGLKIAPAAQGDERAYYAVQAALAAHSLAIHSQVAAANKE